MSSLLLTELETPALCLNLPALQQESELLSGQIQAAGKRWRPPADVHILPELSRWQSLAGACGISLDLLPDVARFAASGLTNIHLTQPPVGSALLPEVLKSFPQLALTVSCDHYAQAEQLSEVACQCGRQISVLIELNVGRNRFGVRPGLDARDLAQGISRLPGVLVRGLSANLGTLQNPEEATRRSDSALGMLEEAKNRLLRDGLCCDSISMAVEGSLSSVLASPLITEIRVGDHFTRNESPTIALNSCLPLVAILATVFSRSKLERAVLDVGESQLDVRTLEEVRVRSSATGRPLPDARIESFDWNSLTLDLGPCSRDVVIGDRILLELDDPRFAFRLFPAVHVMEDGLIHEAWPTAGTAAEITGTAGRPA